MTIRELTEIIKNQNNMPEGLTVSKDKPSSENNDLDQKYADSNKKHRNWISNFDHWYELISHPFVILLVVIGIVAVFLFARYKEIGDPSIRVYSQLHQDTKTILTYFITVIITSVITKFFESRKK